MTSRPPSRFRSSLLALPLVLPLVLIAGCGGSGGGTSITPTPGGSTGGDTGGGVVPLKTSTVVAHIVWPTEDPSRVIPVNTQSLRIELRKDGASLGAQLVARPANSATFNEIPLGSLVVRATAYASADGTGTPLATADVDADVLDGTPLNVSLTLASTIDHLEVAPVSLSLGAGAALPFAVTAKDASGNVVLLAPTALSAASSNAGIVSATGAGGTFTATAALAVGTANLTVTETDSGKTAVIPVTVHPTVTLDAAAATMSVGASRTFVATVRGPADTSVAWSVTESNGGTVSVSGLYTAPAARGTYHLVATCNADPAWKATATITVRSGSGTVTVN